MSIYVLVHGAWHGGWCWEKVVPLLEEAGHRALAPDLPGHGADKTPLAGQTLAAYTDAIGALVDAQPEPVILVGHSLGGLTISQVAEARPERVKTLVYLTANLLPNGTSLMDTVSLDPHSQLGASLAYASDFSSCMLKPESVRAVICADCTDEDVGRIIARLAPEAMAPMATPLSLTESNFGRVPRVYITCSNDVAITPARQQQMYSALPCTQVLTLPTSHSAYYAAPRALADHLLTLV